MKAFLCFIFLVRSWCSPAVGANNVVYSEDDVYNGNGVLNYLTNEYGTHRNLGEILLNKQFDFDIKFNNTRGKFERNGYRFEFDDGNPGQYKGLSREYDFVPFGVETLGPWGPSAQKFFKEIEKRLVEVTGDRRAGGFLAQRISIAIQRGNAASILGTMPQGPVLDLDIHGKIERPCQAYDTFCIRKFFAEHSRCKISGRRLPDPFHRAQATNNYPSANMSAVGDNFVYTGLNAARVVEFYIDTATDNLVIAFSFDAITQASNYTNLKFYLRGREPEIHTGFGSLIYEQITITMVIPGLHDLRLDKAEIYTYAENPLLPFAVSPTLLASSDPDAMELWVCFFPP